MGIQSVSTFTTATVINITGLVPDVRYRVFVKAENALHDTDNTTLRTSSINVTSKEGGEIGLYCHTTSRVK